jgi:hypothetical protein
LAFWYGKIVILNYDYTIADVVSAIFCIIMGGSSIGRIAPEVLDLEKQPLQGYYN